MFEIHELSVNYGGLAAVRGVSLTVKEGQFVAIVGPNGAGKTTLFKAISGTVRPASGKITFEGRDLLAISPPERAHLGISHVPEGRQVFASMTVTSLLPPLNANTRLVAGSYRIASGFFPALTRSSWWSVFRSKTVTVPSRPLLA